VKKSWATIIRAEGSPRGQQSHQDQLPSNPLSELIARKWPGLDVASASWIYRWLHATVGDGVGEILQCLNWNPLGSQVNRLLALLMMPSKGSLRFLLCGQAFGAVSERDLNISWQSRVLSLEKLGDDCGMFSGLE
jgi:hypothetical protein